MEKKKAKHPYWNKILKRIAPAFFIASLIPFIVCICVPFEIFGNNLDEFMFSFSQFIPISILLAFAFSMVFFLAILFLPSKAYKICCAILLAIGFMLFLQGTYLNKGTSGLAGDNLGTNSVSTGKKVLNIIIWIVVIALAVVLALLKDKNGIITLIGVLLCVILFITQLVGPLSLAFSKEGVFADKSQRVELNENSENPKILTYDSLCEVSSDKNVIFFCVDRFDQQYAERAYNECPEIFSELEGFTAFDDNTSLYTHTFPGVANLITQKRYNPEQSRADYLNTVYNDNETIEVLHDNGYDVNLYTQSYYAYTDGSFLPDYVSNVSNATSYDVEKKPLLALSMIQMSLYRCFPLFFKHYLGNINSATCNDFVLCEGENGYSQYDADLKDVYTDISNNGLHTTQDKKFSFIHLEGCHDVKYDENWNKLKKGGDIMLALKGSFQIINEYLKEMKRLGVYKDATIVITGDHASPEGNANGVGVPSLTALYVKKSGEFTGALKHNSAPVTHEEVWATIMESEGIASTLTNRTLFEVPEDEQRVREYFWHNYSSPLEEQIYKITGSAKQHTNWKLESVKYYDKFIMD